MLPPTTPYTERVRIENEKREFERELGQRVIMERLGDRSNWIGRVYRWLLCRLPRPAIKPQSHAAVLPNDSCAESYS